MARYEVTLECFDCDGKGVQSHRHSLSGNPETAVTISKTDCPGCDGRGEISRKVSMYENTKELLKDYPSALNVRLVA